MSGQQGTIRWECSCGTIGVTMAGCHDHRVKCNGRVQAWADPAPKPEFTGFAGTIDVLALKNEFEAALEKAREEGRREVLDIVDRLDTETHEVNLNTLARATLPGQLDEELAELRGRAGLVADLRNRLWAAAK